LGRAGARLAEGCATFAIQHFGSNGMLDRKLAVRVASRRTAWLLAKHRLSASDENHHEAPWSERGGQIAEYIRNTLNPKP